MALKGFLLLTACSDGLTPIEYNRDSGMIAGQPVVTITTGTSLTVNSNLGGDVENVVKRGFCFSSTVSNPTIKNSMTVEADENFSATLTGLTSNTSYNIRAYIYGNSRYTYSEAIMAKTGSIGQNDDLTAYVAPTYADDYSSISSWDKRGQWNLANVHDPSVVLAEDGYYYMYQTDASYGNVHLGHGHFHARRSKDLVNWEYLGATMTSLPTWVIPKLNELRKKMGLPDTQLTATSDFGYWAPSVQKVSNGLYRMYYSIVVPGQLNGEGTWSERAFIGMMENTDLSNNSGWVDKGYVITNASDKGLNFNVKSDNWDNSYYKWNAIDPSYIVDKDGKHYLIYGSWHSGIAIVELDPKTGKVKATLPNPWGTSDDIAAYGTLIATRSMGNRWQASEGPEIVYRGGYYYLFLAYDALDVPYNTRVARAEKITGPYYGINGTNITEKGGDLYPVVTHPYKFANSNGWVGISHCAIFNDGQDNWYYASQGRLPKDVPGINASNAIMMGHVRSIRWTSDGWPVVMPERYGAVPKTVITESEIAGNWENIDLSYKYGVQKMSEKMTLTANHKVNGGTFDGQTWSYDVAAQILKIGSVEFCIQREADWEASPRTATIVYGGYYGTKTYWGKKVE